METDTRRLIPLAFNRMALPSRHLDSIHVAADPCAGPNSDQDNASHSPMQLARESADSGARAQPDEASGSDTDDDLMVVKRRDALDVGSTAAPEAAPAGLDTLGEGDDRIDVAFLTATAALNPTVSRCLSCGRASAGLQECVEMYLPLCYGQRKAPLQLSTTGHAQQPAHT